MYPYFQEIINYLYLGNSKSLEYSKFDLIINCTKENQVPFPTHYPTECIRIPIRDDPSEYNNLLQILLNTDVLEQIHNQITNKKKVLVHCLMGQQRSCAVVACYLIKYRNLTPEESINFIISKRPIAFFGAVNFLQTIICFFQKSNIKKEAIS